MPSEGDGDDQEFNLSLSGDIDLTVLPAGASPSLGGRFDFPKHQAFLRQSITWALLVPFWVVILFPMAVILGTMIHGVACNSAATAVDPTWEHTREIFEVMLPAITGLLGSSVGFYFAERSK
jgi:hypothetical protein